MSSKLTCPCGACQGKLVSSYVHRQHMKKFVVGGDSSGCRTGPHNPSISDIPPDTEPVAKDVTETPGSKCEHALVS